MVWLSVTNSGGSVNVSAISDATSPWLASRIVWSCIHRYRSRCRPKKWRTSSVPQRGQWCEANISSVRSPNNSIASLMYVDQASALRACAPRIGTRLCMVCEQFSAMHSQPWSGKKKFISAGASVSGVNWNSMRTPSTSSSWPVAVMSSVGAIRPGIANGMAVPRPLST